MEKWKRAKTWWKVHGKAPWHGMVWRSIQWRWNILSFARQKQVACAVLSLYHRYHFASKMFIRVAAECRFSFILFYILGYFDWEPIYSVITYYFKVPLNWATWRHAGWELFIFFPYALYFWNILAIIFTSHISLNKMVFCGYPNVYGSVINSFSR